MSEKRTKMLTLWVTEDERRRLLERCDGKQLAAWMRQTCLDERPACEAYSEKLGVDLVSEPDKALEPNNSLFVLIDGFKNRVFTGRKLTDYVSENQVDYLNARRCINGLDHAEQIKGFAQDFLSKLDAGELI